MKPSSGCLRNSFLITLLLFSGIAMEIAAQESTLNNRIYEENKEAVFFVSQAVFIDESKIEHIELFRKLEESMDVELLNQYIPVVTGSAFLINSSGYFITAAHVTQYVDRDDAIDAAIWIFEEYIFKKSIPGYLTKAELHTVFRDYVKAVTDSQFVITLKSVDRIDYRAELIDENMSNDLSLLKIDIEKDISPVVFGSGKPVNVGDKVFTIGYPLQFVMDTFLDDFKPTLTDGIISAIRSDKWDLQHTASINSGNSGGPLFGEGGELIGINLGTLSDANDIYFSTSSKRIREWLADIGRNELLTEEVRDNQ